MFDCINARMDDFDAKGCTPCHTLLATDCGHRPHWFFWKVYHLGLHSTERTMESIELFNFCVWCIFIICCCWWFQLLVSMFNVIDSSDLDTMERKEIEQMVRCRMASLGLASEDYSKLFSWSLVCPRIMDYNKIFLVFWISCMEIIVSPS